jgi:hypothetical protein
MWVEGVEERCYLGILSKDDLGEFLVKIRLAWKPGFERGVGARSEMSDVVKKSSYQNSRTVLRDILGKVFA